MVNTEASLKDAVRLLWQEWVARAELMGPSLHHSFLVWGRRLGKDKQMLLRCGGWQLFFTQTGMLYGHVAEGIEYGGY